MSLHEAVSFSPSGPTCAWCGNKRACLLAEGFQPHGDLMVMGHVGDASHNKAAFASLMCVEERMAR